MTIILDPAHSKDDPGIIGHFGVKEYTINASIAALVAKRLVNSGYLVLLTNKKDANPVEKPALLLTIHTNNINTKSRLLSNKAGLKLAKKLEHRLDSFPQAGSFHAEVISYYYELIDYPFVLLDIGGINPPEKGLVLCPFDRWFWVLAISAGIKDYLEDENDAASLVR